MVRMWVGVYNNIHSPPLFFWRVYAVVFLGETFLEGRVSEMRMWAGIDCQTVGDWNLKESRPEYFVFAPETERKEPFVTGSGRVGRLIGSEKRRQV